MDSFVDLDTKINVLGISINKIRLEKYLLSLKYPTEKNCLKTW